MNTYIIDGYNVLNKLSFLARLRRVNFDNARDRFIELLNKFADYFPCKVIVVFDGRPWQSIYSRDDIIEIRFSESVSTADRIIERMIYLQKSRKDIIVVTDDLLERDMVRGLGCMCMSCYEFENILKQIERLKYKDIKKRHLLNKIIFRGVKLDI